MAGTVTATAQREREEGWWFVL